MYELIYPVCEAPVLPSAVRFTAVNGAGLPSGKAGRAADKGGKAGEEPDEWLPVVEPTGEVVAQAPREFIHSSGDILHPVVHLHIINRAGEIYLQKRSPYKDVYPGLWDSAAGGHVRYGETTVEALFREAREEISFEDFNPVLLDNYVRAAHGEKELVYAYAAVGDFTPTPDGEEVTEGRYWTPAAISRARGTGVLTPDFEFEYEKIHLSLEALL